MRPLLLALALTACAAQPPPSPQPAALAPQWQSTVHGVAVVWRWAPPGSLGHVPDGRPIAGRAWGTLSPCVVDIDAAVSAPELVRVAAHEWAHCAQSAHALPGEVESYADAYAAAYLAACGGSLAPLGWRDYRVPLCAQAPDPRAIAP